VKEKREEEKKRKRRSDRMRKKRRKSGIGQEEGEKDRDERRLRKCKSGKVVLFRRYSLTRGNTLPRSACAEGNPEEMSI